jgi:hypothetical protein|tara:strand:+ start:1148 stop:1510 length:363 start_codon:yes stop_codon:yes gene_type:complete
MAYAQGKYARAICDRCGFDVPYLELKKEWTGFKVCSECFEPKAPQLDPTPKAADPESLYQPRPTVSAPTTGYGIVKTENTKNSDGVTGLSMDIRHNDIIGSSFRTNELTGSLGTVTITTG